MEKENTIAIIGLGYVGLPLAVEFAKKFKTLGYDHDPRRINDLKQGMDYNLAVRPEELQESDHLEWTHDKEKLKDFNIYIVTVPTPIDKNKHPDLRALQDATRLVGEYLRAGDLVIYESTVFPGCTEEVCVPLLEEVSGLQFNRDFTVGYSPERINPGDKEHRVNTVTKVTSGSTPQAAQEVDALYAAIVTAGTHKVESIKVAEAAKVIENCQRDINIAFVNELALIFERLDIDTTEVLQAAGTKWNFLHFTPGLVGGHCIGVDPYYLTYKAQELGYDPQVILSGRRINDAMGIYVAKRVVKALLDKGHVLKEVKALMLGLTYKEDTPDIRNSRAVDLYNELRDFGLKVDVHDSWADKEDVRQEYGIELIDTLQKKYDLIVLAVAHSDYKTLDINSIKGSNAVVFDIKSVLPKAEVTSRL